MEMERSSLCGWQRIRVIVALLLGTEKIAFPLPIMDLVRTGWYWEPFGRLEQNLSSLLFK